MIIRVNENFMGYGKNAEIGREVLDILKHYTPNFETSKIDLNEHNKKFPQPIGAS